MGRISNEILFAAAARAIETTEAKVKTARGALSRLQHTYPELAPLFWSLLEAADELSVASSRLLDMAREHPQ
jgi:hypothetical protein